MRRFTSFGFIAATVLAGLSLGRAAASPGEGFVPTGRLVDGGRDSHSAVRLADGRVLVVGGWRADHSDSRASAETYDPSSGAWSLSGAMSRPRGSHTESLLADGRVLVAGGGDASGTVQASTEIWNPATGLFTAGPSMNVPRVYHIAVGLSDGRILVAGGTSTVRDGYSLLNSAEIYDPAAGTSGTWTATDSMVNSRIVSAAVLLADGRVLIAGGRRGGSGYSTYSMADCEIYDPSSGQFAAVAPLPATRGHAGAALLADGRVLVAGGISYTGGAVTARHDAVVYDPSAGAWTPIAGSLTAGGPGMSLTRLSDGRVLAAGGATGTTSAVTSAADLFDPLTSTFSPLASMNVARSSHSATLLGNGSVLIAGGAFSTSAPYATSSAELFVPAAAPPPNQPPTANAGSDQSIHAGDLVTLDGTASNDDNTLSVSLVYAWTLSAKPAGSAAELMGAASSAPNFTADKTGSYTASLVVTDEGGLASVADEVMISSNNVAPTANAGVDLVTAVDLSPTITGTATDPEGDAKTYLWTITSAPVGSTATLSGATTLSPSLTPDEVGAYVLSLVASDPYDDSVADTMTLTVISGSDYAEGKLQAASTVIAGLPSAAFDSPGHGTAMSSLLGNVVKELQKGKTADAATKLRSLIERTDGFALRNAADGNGPGMDWIVTEEAQNDVYTLLTAALDALSP